MTKRKFFRTRSQKQAKGQQQQNPTMVEDEKEQPSEPPLQDQNAEDQDLNSMDEDSHSQQPQDQASEEDQDPKLVDLRRTRSKKQAKDQKQQNPKMVEDEQDQASELPQQDRNAEVLNPKSMEGDQPSQRPRDHSIEEDQDFKLVQLRRTRSQKQGKDQKQQNPKMVEDEQEQPSEPPQEVQNPKSMEEDPPSQKSQDQNPEDDQDPKLVEDEDQIPKLVLVEEELQPQDQGHDGDGNGTRDLENQPREAQSPKEIHDLENQPEEATAHPEVEKVDEEELQPLQPQHEQEQEREEEEHQQHQQREEEEGPEPDGMALSPTLPPPPPPVHEITFPDIIPGNTLHNALNVCRKGPKRKKTLNQRQRAALEKKLQAVKEKLQPIPFIPSKTLDFSKHEKLLKRLGLWDFAHLEFDREIRKDLLTQLIVTYNPQSRCSYVNDFRIMVNRTDLGRALKLTPKKDKSSQLEAADSDLEKLHGDSVAFVEDFVSTWFFLHEDTWILPNEIVAWTKLIRDGHPEKVDWPRLIWFMVEKELTQSSQLGSCYYASHLQCLMKAQHAVLFEEPITEVYNIEEEDAVDIKETILADFQGQDMESQQIELSLGQVKTDCEQVKDEDDVIDLQGQEMESQQIELSLGHVKTHCEQVKDEDNVMDFQDCKDDEPSLLRLGEVNTDCEQVKDEDVVMDFKDCQDEEPNLLQPGQVKTYCEQVKDEDDVMDFQDCKDDEPSLLQLDGRNHVGEHFLQRCNQNELCGFERGHERKEEEKEEQEEEEEEEEDDEEEEEERNDLLSKPATLERLSSSDLFQAMGAANLPYNMPAHLFSHPSGELLTPRLDNINSAGPSMFRNGCKRELDHDVHFNHHSFNDHKRMRSDGPWEEHKASDFDFCMEQVQSWIGKARMMHGAKDQEIMNAHLQQQALMSELQQRANIIEALQRSKAEEEQKRQLEIYRYEHELYVMSNLLNGYKKALKETRRSFTEYRERYPQPDEPLYKDVAGTGGFVLSSKELDKQKEEREEELRVKRIMFEEQIRDFEQSWLGKFELHLKKVNLLGSRLFDLENGTKLLKESLAKHEVSET
ncbi:uncharacterized protein LOC122091339 [Macadamia integrifolia]|uniref:uncharacterized protein LOC122091339 n=1 Tax=Macadamia integrifolia TaxID=60698 RepID=UPI001C4EE036|nr:uncharacterized protein LOC122091339 [Macadamia integrifolia]